MDQYRSILMGDASAWFYTHRSQWFSAKNQLERRRANSWQACLFARQWYGRNIDLARLQSIVMRSDIAEPAIFFARDVPGANIKRLERHVMKHGTAKEMRTFASVIPGANVERLMAMAMVAEIMSDVMSS